MSASNHEQRYQWNQDCSDLRMNAYYYGFDGTGERAIDLVLSAVATAGKGSHHTENWGEYGHVERIQTAADAAAVAIRELRAQRDEAREVARYFRDTTPDKCECGDDIYSSGKVCANGHEQ